MDWLGTNLAYKKVEYLLDNPFNMELYRLHHLTRLSHQPTVLYKSIHSEYFVQFMDKFSIDGMTIEQAVYGIQWMKVLCKEPTIAARLSILPFEKMITHTHPEVRKVTLSLLIKVLSLTVSEIDGLKLSSRLHSVLFKNLIVQSKLKEHQLSELEDLMDCLKNLEFGSDQKNEFAVISAINQENISIFIQKSTPSKLKTATILYLVKLNYFKCNRETFYASSLLDVILTISEKQPHLTLLKNVLSMDVRMKRLLIN